MRRYWLRMIKVSKMGIACVCAPPNPIVFTLEWLSYVEHTLQPLLNTCMLVSILGAAQNHVPLKYNIGVQIREVTE